jgi:3-dehydroquinate dehydratase
MIHELQQSSSKNFAMDSLFPEALAIVYGNNPGWIFVDDIEIPSAALVWAQGIEGFYLIGDANCEVFHEELEIYTDIVIKPRLNKLGKTELEISGDETWDLVMENIYKSQNLKSSQQWVFTLKPTTKKEFMQQKLDGDYEIKRINGDLIADLSVGSKEFLYSKIHSFWRNLEAFISRGKGFVLTNGEEIVSLCFSGFVSENIHVMDIETKESHRRKGYAEIVSQAYIADCIDEGFRLHWDCMAENYASIRLAKKLGFKKSHVYTLYSFSLQ